MNKNNRVFCLVFHKNCITFHYFIMYFRFTSSISSISIINIIKNWSIFEKIVFFLIFCSKRKDTVFTWIEHMICGVWWFKSGGVNDRMLCCEYLNGWLWVCLCVWYVICVFNKLETFFRCMSLQSKEYNRITKMRRHNAIIHDGWKDSLDKLCSTWLTKVIHEINITNFHDNKEEIVLRL